MLEFWITPHKDLGDNWWNVREWNGSPHVITFHRDDTLYFGDGTIVDGLTLSVLHAGWMVTKTSRAETGVDRLIIAFAVPKRSSFFIVPAIGGKGRVYNV